MCMTLHAWVAADEFPAWAEVKSMLPELRSLWHHRNNLSIDANGTLWRKRSSQNAQLQLLVPKAGRERLFLSYHASLYGGHLGRTRTLARLADRFYWSGMADDVKDWLSQCVACIKRKSPVGRHHPLGNIPTGHRWDRIAMDILDVCNELGGNMARSTQFPIMITRSTIIYEIVSPGAAGSSIYI